MTAFLYVQNGHAQPAQQVDFARVDLARIASLFVEADVVPQARARRRLLEIAAAALLVIAAAGDTLLVTGPDWLSAGPAPSRQVDPL